MDCIIMAGGQPAPEDPMYAYTPNGVKAQIDMAGRTMLERVVDALQGSKYIEDIVVVGLGSDMDMTFQRPIHHLPDHGGMISNIVAGVKFLRQHKPDTQIAMACSADVPTITSAIIDDFVESCQPFDKAVYYNLVTREVMEKRFPHSNRTYVKLKGIDVAGGDVIIAQVDLVDTHEDLFVSLTNARKHAWQIARIVGFSTLIKLLLRQLSIQDMEKKGHDILGRPIKAVMTSHAEIAMDADKPSQVDMLRQDLISRGA